MSGTPRSPLGSDSRLKRYENLAEMIGDRANPTPMVALNRVGARDDLRLYAKLEWMNPFGSVKDRTAKWLIDELVRKGALDGKTVLEPTSGNTGIALAALCAVLGQPMSAIVPFNMPAEKKTLLRILDAEVKYTPADAGGERHPMDIAMDMARELLASSDEYVMANQYDNPENPRAHYETTGPEIWEQTEGQVRYFFAGIGTCGTISGAGRFLKEQDPSIRVVAIEPIPGHHISGLKNMMETSVPANMDNSVIDEIIYVDDAQARAMSLRLHAEEALFAGSSGAAAVSGALRYLEGREGVAVVIIPDSSQKAIGYLHTALESRER